MKPKKISWLRTPEISRFRGFFSRFLAFSQSWGLRIQSAEKKISFQKNGFGQDVEQLSPAAKAQYPFLRAESAVFRVAKAFCSTFCPFFVFLFVKYLCLPERRLVIGYITWKQSSQETIRPPSLNCRPPEWSLQALWVGSVRHPLYSGDAGMRLRQIAEWVNINFALRCHIL